MKNKIRKYLFRQPTLFAWLALLCLPFALWFGLVTIRASIKNPEALMGILLVLYILGLAMLFVAADIFCRKIFAGRFVIIWLLQAALAMALFFVIYHRYVYRTRIVTENWQQWIILVENVPEGKDPERNFWKQETTLRVPADGILFLKSALKQKEKIRISAFNQNGEAYNEIHPFNFFPGKKNDLVCGEKIYPVEIWVLEREKAESPDLTKKIQDSLLAIACEKILIKADLNPR